jgi:hypothetical protein
VGRRRWQVKNTLFMVVVTKHLAVYLYSLFESYYKLNSF